MAERKKTSKLLTEATVHRFRKLARLHEFGPGAAMAIGRLASDIPGQPLNVLKQAMTGGDEGKRDKDGLGEGPAYKHDEDEILTDTLFVAPVEEARVSVSASKAQSVLDFVEELTASMSALKGEPGCG